MGASGSMVGGRDGNIEMKIADEAQRSGHATMPRHSSQPASNLFSSLIPRQKHSDGGLRPPGSLRSSSSFDPTSASTMAFLPEAPDKVRKEYDTLKLIKDQEIQALTRKEEKLETENNRLRAELQALNKQCQKLRAERDTAIESSYIATERATALEQDREKIQRHFKIFRETKESEIQALLQAKRQLEGKFQRLQAHGMATIDDHNFSENDNTNHLMQSTEVGGQKDWWVTPESEATSLFGSYAQLPNNSRVGYSESIPDMQGLNKPLESRQTPQETDRNIPSSPDGKDMGFTTSTSLLNALPMSNTSDICDHTMLRCYISCTPDVLADAKALVSHPELQHLKDSCEAEGYFLSVIHFLNLDDYKSIADDRNSTFNTHEAIQYAISKSSLFISFLGKTKGRYTDIECQEGPLQSPGSKSVLFCIKNNSKNSHLASADLIKRVHSSSSKKCVSYSATIEACDVALKEIAKAVRLEFGIRVQNEISSSQTFDPSDVPCIEEMLSDPQMEQLQQELAAYPNDPSAVVPVGIEKSLDRLDEVVASPGPVPPLLVSGTSGSGKTLLLSSWTTQLRMRRPDVLILQHFVTGPNSSDSEPVIVLRRLLLQLCQHLPPGHHPPVQSYSTFDVTRLRETLPRWLEQFSSRRNRRILLVIDSIDLIKETQRHFGWLLDPLHVGVRVITSVGVDSCPEEWRQLPTLHLEPLSIQSVKALLKNHARIRDICISPRWERDVISQCRTATTCHPLYVTLLSVLVCSVCKGQISENVFYACSRKQDSTELYHLFLRDIEMKCTDKEARNHLKAILQFLTCSRNGLSETEIMSLLPELTWYSWINLLRKLTTLCIVKEQAGLIMPHNSEVTSFLYNHYVSNDVHERRYRQKMISWLTKIHNERMTPRSTELLLWLLHKEDEREALLKILRSPYVFHFMYSRGRSSELVDLWNYLNEAKHTIARYYLDSLKKMEATSSGDVTAMTKIAEIYESLGRFFKNMGLFEEAVSSLQRSLEIQETVLDPDHPAVADSLHHLASVYAQWGKLSTAEPLFKQSVELIETTVGKDHLRVAQGLSALVRIARKTGRKEIADALQQRVWTITSRNGTMTSNRFRRLRKQALRLEELALGDDSLEVAQALNDLGVLYHLRNNLKNAESFFERSLKIRKELADCEHSDVTQSLHNLASVYTEQKKFDKAIDCMTDALKIRKKQLGPNDGSVMNTLKYLAILYKKTGDHVKACEIYKELLQVSIEISGKESDSTANALVNLAVSECQGKNLDAALPLYKRALAIYRNTTGRNSQQVSQTLRNIAVLLFQQGKLEEAASVYKESMGSKHGDPASW